jgi:hypothetical protein
MAASIRTTSGSLVASLAMLKVELIECLIRDHFAQGKQEHAIRQGMQEIGVAKENQA